MKVLLVDDEKHVLDGLTAMMDWSGMSVTEVLTAMDGEEAWQSYLHDRPDIVITDVAMPRMNGLELAGRIREADPDTPILFLSGYDDFEYAREAVHLHASKYMLKPAVFYEIQQAIREMIVELEAKRRQSRYAEQFKQYVEQSLPALREQFLYELVTGAKVHTDLAESMLRFYGVEELASGGLLFGLMLYRPLHGRAKTERDWQLFKFSAANIAAETIAPYCGQEQARIYLLRYEEDRLPVLVAHADAARARELAASIAGALLRNVADFLDLELNIAIGRWYGSAAELGKSYGEVVETLRSLEFEGYDKMMTVDQAESDLAGKRRYPGKLVHQCVEAIQKFHPADVSRHWQELKDWLLQEEVPLGIVQIVGITIWGNLLLGVAEETTAGHDAILPQWMLNLQESRSRQSIVTGLDEQFGLLLKPLQQRDSQQLAYVRQVIEYIEQHYAESISFDELSKQLHLTRSYLSYLFKRETGINFIHYLTDYRIERAKELLLSGQHMIYEISALVGYSDPAYFSRVFKKMTGKPPLEFV